MVKNPPKQDSSNDEIDKILAIPTSWHDAEDYLKAEQAINQYCKKREALAELKVWETLKRREGFSLSEDGCIEVHPDFIDEQIKALKEQTND
jgi:hypothetical protein